jgi:hypothetical protein
MLLLVAACSSDDDASTETTAPSTAVAVTTPTTAAETTSTVPEPTGMSVGRLLDEIPASLRPPDGELMLIAGDLDLATELVGVERPAADDPGDLDALLEWLNPVQGVLDETPVAGALLPEAIVPRNLQRNDEIAAEFGWSVFDLHSFIELQHPPTSFAVLDVGVTADELTSTIGAPVDGIWRLGGDEDSKQDLKNTTAGRPLGDTLRFALDDDGLLGVSKVTPPVEAWLAGSGDTLAGDAKIASVAAVLDAAGVYSAMIIDDQNHVDLEQSNPTLLPVFDLLGVGLSMVDGEAIGTFVYHYPSADDATAAVDTTRAVFTEGVSVRTARPLNTLIEVVDIVTTGENVVVTVTFPEGESRPVNIWSMVYARDLPTVHG